METRPMAKRRTPKTDTAKPLNLPIVVLMIALIGVAIGAVWVLSRPAAPAEGVAMLTAEQYVSTYADGQTPHFLLDVRTPEEFASGHIAGAVNISLQTLQSNLASVPKDQPVVIYCRSGNRSATAAQVLAEAGYTQVFDMGGILRWQSLGLPVQ
jgi:rhodanese-related sulfurtransferase